MKKIVDFIFFITLGRLYLDWILITNPKSHNPLIKLIFGWAAHGYTAWNYKVRYKFALAAGIMHFVFAIGMLILDNFHIGIINLLFNIYPVWVQLYVGYRLSAVIRHKNSQKNKLFFDGEIYESPLYTKKNENENHRIKQR